MKSVYQAASGCVSNGGLPLCATTTRCTAT